MKLSVWLAFGVYCLLVSLAWIVTPFGDQTSSFFERQIILFALVGSSAIVFSMGGIPKAVSKLPWMQLVAAGVSFWSVPEFLVYWAGSSISSFAISAAFALLPVFVVLVVSSIGVMQDKGEGWGSLVPALAAFGGVLLLLPVDFPGTGKGQLMLVAVFIAVVLMAVSGVWMHLLMQGVVFGRAVAVVCFANVIFLTICGLVTGGFANGWSNWKEMLSLSSGIDLIEMILAFWLLREMPPVRFATRYLVIPLLTVVGGYVVLRPQVTARMIVAVVLLIGGVLRVLFSGTSKDEAILSLR